MHLVPFFFSLYIYLIASPTITTIASTAIIVAVFMFYLNCMKSAQKDMFIIPSARTHVEMIVLCVFMQLRLP